MEDFAFVAQLCEDQALCIKVQLLRRGTAQGLLRCRMKWNQAFQSILSETISIFQGGNKRDLRVLKTPPPIPFYYCPGLSTAMLLN